MMWCSEMKNPGVSKLARLDRDAGITLFELLVVLVIIALLATLVAPRVIGYLGRSKRSVAEAQMSNISTSLELFYLDNGRYPLADEGLDVLVTASETLPAWRGPYFGDQAGLVDPWGRPYGYALNETGDRFVLTSLGRDGVVGGEGEDGDLSRS